MVFHGFPPVFGRHCSVWDPMRGILTQGLFTSFVVDPVHPQIDLCCCSFDDDPLPSITVLGNFWWVEKICFRGVETMKPCLEWRWDTPWLGAILPVAPRTATLPADEVWLGIEKPCWLLISHIHWRIICGELNLIILKSSISWGFFNIDCGNWDDHNGNEVGNPTEILEPASRIRWLEGQAPGLMTLESQMVEFLEDEITLQAMVIAIHSPIFWALCS